MRPVFHSSPHSGRHLIAFRNQSYVATSLTKLRCRPIENDVRSAVSDQNAALKLRGATLLKGDGTKMYARRLAVHAAGIQALSMVELFHRPWHIKQGRYQRTIGLQHGSYT